MVVMTTMTMSVIIVTVIISTVTMAVVVTAVAVAVAAVRPRAVRAGVPVARRLDGVEPLLLVVLLRDRQVVADLARRRLAHAEGRLEQQLLVLADRLHVLEVRVVGVQAHLDHLADRVVHVELGHRLEPAEAGLVHRVDLLVAQHGDVAAHREEDDVVDGQIRVEEDVAEEIPRDERRAHKEENRVRQRLVVEEVRLELGPDGDLEPVGALAAGVAGEERLRAAVLRVPAEAVDPVDRLELEAAAVLDLGLVVLHSEPRVAGRVLEVVGRLDLEDASAAKALLPRADA